MKSLFWKVTAAILRLLKAVLFLFSYSRLKNVLKLLLYNKLIILISINLLIIF
jgi:hypothetical protein